MKSHSWTGLGFSITISLAGISAIMNCAQAADIGAPILEIRSGRTAVTGAGSPDRQEFTANRHIGRAPQAKGAQGPIREKGSDTASRAWAALFRQDMESGRFPMRNSVGVP